MNIKYNLSKLQGKIIAIDGPAGSGKSTTAKIIADQLGYTYLDTEVTRQVSEVAAHKKIREVMVNKQKEFGKKGSIVAEGRDTTTVVFTNAHLKIYLNATIEERAQRRLIDLTRMGITTSMQEIREDIQRRDNYDSNREHSPLTIAQDAIVIDTSNLTIEDQVDKIISLAIDTF